MAVLYFSLFWIPGCPQTFPSRSTNFGLSVPSQDWQKALVKKVLLFWRLEDVSIRSYLQQSLKPVHSNLIALLKYFLLPVVTFRVFFLLSAIQWLMMEKNQLDSSFLSFLFSLILGRCVLLKFKKHLLVASLDHLWNSAFCATGRESTTAATAGISQTLYYQLN